MPEYQIRLGIIRRCTYPQDKSWMHYGGRGIKICDRWLGSFYAFMDDMGPRPSDEHSIDRIDNDRGYEPGNCRWATVTQQMRNRTDSAFVEFNGVRLTLVEWSERLGVSQALISWRVKAWGIERALTTFGAGRQRKVATEPGLEVVIEELGK